MVKCKFYTHLLQAKAKMFEGHQIEPQQAYNMYICTYIKSDILST